MANEGYQNHPEYARAGHLGYYLIGKGIKNLMQGVRSAIFLSGTRSEFFKKNSFIALYRNFFICWPALWPEP